MKQLTKKIKILLLLLFLHTLIFAQNAGIFKGGTDDGWVSQNYAQGSSNIFKGGNADGWASQNYSQSSANIFKGGGADGWSSQNYLQSSVSIFKGGNGDGWDSKNYMQASTSIFNGGMGDGWASSYLPQRALPVTFIYFTAKKQGYNAAIVEWKTGAESNSNYFDVERSRDAVNFEGIGKISALGSPALGMSYTFTDNHPLKGVNYYRLKQVDKDNAFTYTPARLLSFDEDNAGIVKYYPNPTNGILNIEITRQMQGEAIIINISNVNGAVVNQVKMGGSSSSVISVSMKQYPKGIYFVQLKTGSTNSVQRIIVE